MDKLEKAKGELLDAIRESEAYQRFEEARIEMEDYPDKKARVDCFRSHSYELSNSEDPLEPPSKMEQLARDRLEVRQDPLCTRYLDAEMELCRMLQDICLSVISVIDLQIEPFEMQILKG